MWLEKECHRTVHRSPKTNLKAACSWISYDRNTLEFRFWEKTSLENVSYCHLFIRPWKQSSKVSNELYRCGETWKTEVADITALTASNLSVKVRYIFEIPGIIGINFQSPYFSAWFTVFSLLEETWMKTTAVWCWHPYGLKWYYEILWCFKLIHFSKNLNRLSSARSEVLTLVAIAQRNFNRFWITLYQTLSWNIRLQKMWKQIV